MGNQWARLRLVSLAGLAVGFLGACDVSVRSADDEENQREKAEYASWTGTPGTGSYQFASCKASSATVAASGLCGSRPDAPGSAYLWQSNCQGSACSTVYVYAHYALSDDLGANQTLHVEAFSDPKFQGQPVASLQISGFDASKPSSSRREELFLAQGEYYFRAYLSAADAAPVPYSLQGMQLVSDAPVGVLGALSGAERVVVASSGPQDEVVHITINQLFQKPSEAEPTDARLRLKLSLAGQTAVEKNRDIRILLLKNADIEIKPLYTFALSSNSLTTEERATEFVSGDLEPGSYFVYVYIDSNSNGYADEGELGTFVGSSEQPIVIEKDRTRSVSLSLGGA